MTAAGHARSCAEGRVVAIHQPNFFPWLGYFAKIARSDRFVLLDDAQLPKKGGSWVNRVRVGVNGKAHWVTAAVDRRKSGVQSIDAAKFGATGWRDEMLRLLDNAYRKAPFRDEAMTLIEPLINNSEEGVALYNIHTVTTISDALGLDTGRFIRSSELDIHGSATKRLVAIVETLEGTGYLSGDGASGYQEDELFAEHGLDLFTLDFQHPRYAQLDSGSEFLPGLSIIDALHNLGISGTAELLGPHANAGIGVC